MHWRVAMHTENPYIFTRILFSQIALKDILATGKFRDKDMIDLYQWSIEWFRHFAWILFSPNFAYAKFRENKTRENFRIYSMRNLFYHMKSRLVLATCLLSYSF